MIPLVFPRFIPFQRTFSTNNFQALHLTENPLETLDFIIPSEKSFNKQLKWDIIVIGGGHAGIEAAYAAANRSLKTLLITTDINKIGIMSCNPSIGGVGKGTLVRETDALGGIIGRCADQSGIQFRMLNKSRGPAIYGPRAQIDRNIYRKEIQKSLGLLQQASSDFHIMEGNVVDFGTSNNGTQEKKNHIENVVLDCGTKILASNVILTTGTFLGGILHCGKKRLNGGRLGESPTSGLESFFQRHKFPLGRMKTATPPRIERSSINYQGLKSQPSDSPPSVFSFHNEYLGKLPALENYFLPTLSTHTTQETVEIIHKQMKQHDIQPLFTTDGAGQIPISPRYCPSIEGKCTRFPEKKHRIWLEFEGLDSNIVYPNGLANAFDPPSQMEIVKSIPGLENAEMIQPGYAVEYSFLQPTCLKKSLESKIIPGLFLAGQINGTTGYEEAACQGIVAGINATRKCMNKDPLPLSRGNSFVGTMIDDLTNHGTVEPFRMFTSRSEHRLHARSDNADLRLSPMVSDDFSISLPTVEQFDLFFQFSQKLVSSSQLAEKTKFPGPTGTPTPLSNLFAGQGLSLDLGDLILKSNSLQRQQFKEIFPFSSHKLYPRRLQYEMMYIPHIQQQNQHINAFDDQLEEISIPPNFNWETCQYLTSEETEKLTSINPINLDVMRRIPGIRYSSVIATGVVLKVS